MICPWIPLPWFGGENAWVRKVWSGCSQKPSTPSNMENSRPCAMLHVNIDTTVQEKDEGLSKLLITAERIFSQTRNDTNKVYNVRAPAVECIAKGKAYPAARWPWSAAPSITGFWQSMRFTTTPLTVTPSSRQSDRPNASPAGSLCTPIATAVIGELLKLFLIQCFAWPAKAKRA
jgi:hypothetical protein